MSEKNTGGPAFPVSTSCSNGEYGHQDGHTTWQFPGISIRDYFAAHAPLETLKFSDAEAAAKFAGCAIPTNDDELIVVAMRAAAKASFIYADEMLKARES